MLIFSSPLFWWVRFFAISLHRQTKKPKLMNHKNLIQLITAAVMAIGGLILLFCGTYIDPKGEISNSLLIGFGEVATFAGALFGIDAAYNQKLWEFINSTGKNPKPKPSADNSTPAKKTSSQAKQKTLLMLPPPSRTSTTSSPQDSTE